MTVKFYPRASSLLAALAFFMLGLWSNFAAAQVNSLEPFLGHWTGIALTEHYQEPGLFGYEKRDLNVEIARNEGGFSITWVTEIRGKEESEDRRRETTMDYKLVEPGLFEAVDFSKVNDNGSPFGVRFSWARIDNGSESQMPSLIVSVLEIDNAGIAELSHYHRRIDSAGQMNLEFVRDREGRRLRRVTGKLIPKRQ